MRNRLNKKSHIPGFGFWLKVLPNNVGFELAVTYLSFSIKMSAEGLCWCAATDAKCPHGISAKLPALWDDMEQVN